MKELKNAVMQNEPATEQLAQLIAERDVYILHAQKTEQRAEAAEADRDEARRQLAEAQCAIDVLSSTVVAQNNEIKRLRQKREDVAEYRAEIARLNQAATA